MLFELWRPEVFGVDNSSGAVHFSVGSDNLCVPLLDVENSDDSSRRSSEHQDCNVSDFYISDMIFSGLPIERNLSFDNNVDSMFLPDYKCEESNIFCDLAEDYMVLPLLEDTLETRYDHGGKASGEIISNANDSSLYLAIHQLRSSNQDTDINIYPNSDQADSFDPQIYIRNLPDQLDAISTLPHANILKEKQKTKQITLVLDLDGKYIVPQISVGDFVLFNYSKMSNLTIPW